MINKQSYVYIMASKTGVLYIGVTSDLARRVSQHKAGTIPGFSEKYKTKRLVFYEVFSDIRLAISREKQIKGWKRDKKMHIISELNPDLVDLSLSWE